jgi:hypothetical protein
VIASSITSFCVFFMFSLFPFSSSVHFTLFFTVPVFKAFPSIVKQERKNGPPPWFDLRMLARDPPISGDQKFHA